jgi:mannose-6-phosphate isomerase-like protein (cupin superfamily)
VIVPGPVLRFAVLPGRDSANPFEGWSPEGLSMRVARLETRRRSPHRHPLSQEAIYVVSGRGALWYEGLRHRLQAGDSALIERGAVHAIIPDRGSSMQVVCFFPHSDLEANLEEIDEIVIVEDDKTEGTDE